MKILPFISLFFIAALLPMGVGAEIIKEVPQKYELDNFTETVTKNAWSANIASMEAISDHPAWPHDIWADPKGNYYISFYYENKESSIGYTSVYFDNYGNRLPSNCKLTLKLVEPYYGMNVTEENTTDPVENVTENENIQPVAVIVPENGSHDDENIIMINSDNSTVKTNEVENNTIENNVENSTNVVSNQGFIGTVEQWWFDFSNTDWSNVSFNFWG